MKTLQFLSAIIIIIQSGNVFAQLNPIGSSYFQNQYLNNPAMAGVKQGFELGGSYRALWTAIDGAPSVQALTFTYGSFDNKIGLGFNFYNENAGAFRRAGIKGTYAFHLPLNNNSAYIDFGLSGGIMNEWIDWHKVVADSDDQSLQNFNSRKPYVDGDFGVAYRDEYLTLQGNIPNLKRFLNRDLWRNSIDRFLFMASMSHKFYNQGGIITSIEPKAVYRGIYAYKDIFDLGAQIKFWENKLMLSGLYHSTNSMSVGVGTLYQDQLSILCFYTTGTADLGKYSNGEFEISLHYQFR